MDSFLHTITDFVGGRAHHNEWRVRETTSSIWIHVLHTKESPAQGWKLHLSANEHCANELLRRALPVLLEETASFKILASPTLLNDLNEGHGGIGQVGKFVTVYPNDDAQAVRLATALDEATLGLRGPRIPSDRPLRMGSAVFYRYGGFSGHFMQTAIGQLVPALSAPNGELVPDERQPVYAPPSWINDPFIAAGVAKPLRTQDRVLRNRYLILTTIHRSVRGSVLSAIDLVEPRPCLIKRAERYALVGPDGEDACDRLRHEMKILARLAPDDRFPKVLDLIEEGEDLYLVMTPIEGITLEEHVRSLSARGRLTASDHALCWAHELVAALEAIHEQGIIYRDLKSSNILVGDDGHLRIVDFELAHEVGCGSATGRGTPGYMSPQQQRGDIPSKSDDIYGLGAVLYFLASAAEPSNAPRVSHLLDRPVELLNSDVHSGMVRLIERCLDPNPKRRFRSMGAVARALRRIETAPATISPMDDTSSPSTSREDGALYRQLAADLAETLCRSAQSGGEDRLCWLSTHESRDGIAARDLSVGCAGGVLALAGLVAEIPNSAHRDVLAHTSRSLAATCHWSSALLPGLYVGEAGVGAALLLAGLVLEDDQLVASALDRGRIIGSIPYVSPDMFNGTAGRLRFHLWLWDATSDREQLGLAEQAGSALLKSAEGSEGSGIWWTIPPGYGGLSNQAYLGYAHGAAGIADALLDLFEATGDDRFLIGARSAAIWIAQHATPVLADDDGVDWPDVPDGTCIGPYWCHGAAGVGQFFLHGLEFGVPYAEDLALRAARAVACGGRASGPTQCHGLAGSIEYLLDVFQVTRDPTYLDEALLLGRLLRAFGRVSNGLLVWPSESNSVVTPDYTVGYAGVAACLLRLTAPARLPRQLSRLGFSFYAGRGTPPRATIGSDTPVRD